MANGSGNVSSILSLGGVDAGLNLTIPEANSPGYFTLYATDVGVSSGNYSPFYKNGAIYQVSAGKTCQVVTVLTFGTATDRGQLVYSLTTFAINASTITSGVFQCGAAGNYMFTNFSGTVPTSWAVTYSFPQNSFPGVQSNTIPFILICKEV